MSIPFSQSLRALRHDRAGFGRWPAVAGVLLLGGWLAWFVYADIPVNERSTDVLLLSSTEAEASFSPAAAANIEPGQEGRLHLRAGGLSQAAILPATVTDVSSTLQNGAVRVHFILQPSAEQVDRRALEAADFVEIRVAQLTPAELFLQAAGRGR